MSWLSFLRPKPMPIEARRERTVEYLGEKTGPTEDGLKRSLEPLLRQHHKVERAYLAIISTDARKTWSVALCLASDCEDRMLVQEVSEVFHHMFGRGQFLDVLFVWDDAEKTLRSVCSPFYDKHA